MRSNNTLINIIATFLNDKEVLYNINYRRLRCNGYVINLAIQAFLFKKIVYNYKYLGNKAKSSFDI